MSWFRKKEHDPVAEYRAELDRQIAEAEQARTEDPFFEKMREGMQLAINGGWCAPSEVIYDLPDMLKANGLVAVKRGGLKI